MSRCDIVEHKLLTLNGNTIHYYVSGNSGSPAVLFLHPAFGDHTCFYKQIDFFSKEFRVVTIDLIGHGLSKVCNSKQKIDSSIEHIRAIMAAENIESLHLVGVSMGALIAQHFVLYNPAKTLSLTCLGGYDINRVNKEVAKAQRKEMLGWLLRLIFSMRAFKRYAASVSAINKEEQERLYESMQGFTRKSFSAMSTLGRLIKERPTPARDYPLSILVGDTDNDLAKRMARLWHGDEPKSLFYQIDSAGHCANMDNADAFNQIVYGAIVTKSPSL